MRELEENSKLRAEQRVESLEEGEIPEWVIELGIDEEDYEEYVRDGVDE